MGEAGNRMGILNVVGVTVKRRRTTADRGREFAQLATLELRELMPRLKW